jgi:hypothetical protein
MRFIHTCELFFLISSSPLFPLSLLSNRLQKRIAYCPNDSVLRLVFSFLLQLFVKLTSMTVGIADSASFLTRGFKSVEKPFV